MKFGTLPGKKGHVIWQLNSLRQSEDIKMDQRWLLSSIEVKSAFQFELRFRRDGVSGPNYLNRWAKCILNKQTFMSHFVCQKGGKNELSIPSVISKVCLIHHLWRNSHLSRIVIPPKWSIIILSINGRFTPKWGMVISFYYFHTL